MRRLLITELKHLEGKKHVSKNDLKQFLEKINCPDPLIRDENPASHICFFYLPIDVKKKELYLVIHKKSGLWMPPGGHIDTGETPREAVKRECQEELNFTITKKPIELFTISIEDIDNPKQSCKKHYSLWYIVKMKHKEFAFNTQESGDGRWVSFDDAKKIVTFYSYIKPIASISSYLEL